MKCVRGDEIWVLEYLDWSTCKEDDGFMGSLKLAIIVVWGETENIAYNKCLRDQERVLW